MWQLSTAGGVTSLHIRKLHGHKGNTAAVLLCDVTAYTEVCLLSRCLETGCITLLFYCCVHVLLSNGCFCSSTILAQSKYATKNAEGLEWNRKRLQFEMNHGATLSWCYIRGSWGVANGFLGVGGHMLFVWKTVLNEIWRNIFKILCVVK
jgi:hypothetical protein